MSKENFLSYGLHIPSTYCVPSGATNISMVFTDIYEDQFIVWTKIV